MAQPVRSTRTIEAKAQREMQGIFRIELISGIGTTTTGGLDEAVSRREDVKFRPRKSHRKSRNGCRNCKARHIKCDENSSLGCGQCRKHDLECDFVRSRMIVERKGTVLVQGNRNRDCRKNDSQVRRVWQQPAWTSQTQRDITSDGSVQDFSILPSASSLMLGPTLEISAKANSRMTSPLASLHHFEAFTSYTCGSPLGQRILKSSVLTRAVYSPYLMHAMLGVAAAHMTYLLPPSVNAVQHARNKAADAWHWGQALALFRGELGGEGPGSGARRDNMDALLSTIMMVAVHQFMLREDDGRSMADVVENEDWRNSFVFVENDNERMIAMAWLTIQSGFKMLLDQFERHLPESVWFPVFKDASPSQHFASLENISVENTNEVEKILLHFCQITSESTEDDNPYYSSLETVLYVRRLRPIGVESFNKLITVMGRVTPDLKRLFWERDAAALMILCHWLSLMHELRQWWIMPRAQRECRAIIMYLLAQDRDFDVARRIRKVVEEPAQVIGMKL